MEKVLLVVDRKARTIRGLMLSLKVLGKHLLFHCFVFLCVYRYQFIWHPLLVVTVGFIVNIKSSFSSIFYYGRDWKFFIYFFFFLILEEWKAIWIPTSRLRLGTAVTMWWCYTDIHWCFVKCKKWSGFVWTWDSYYLNVLKKWLRQKSVYKKHCSCSNFSSVALL